MLLTLREAAGTRKDRAVKHLRWLVFLLIVLLLPGAGWTAQCGKPRSGQGDDNTIKVDVDLVVLHATVTKRDGTRVLGLEKKDFQVYEDGVLQELTLFSREDIPVVVGLVVDNSGSMRPKRREVIVAAAAFARSSKPHDQMFVVNFNEHVTFGLPENTPFTSSVARLEVALSRVAAQGMTALYDAVAAALEHLKKSDRDKKVLIVISDGRDNSSSHSLAQVVTMAEQSDAIIYTIGLFDDGDPDRNPGVLRQFAKATGGEAFLPRFTKDVVSLCEQIADDVRKQYTLAYAPTNRTKDRTYRAIEVKAAAARNRLVVRTRAGYYAPSTDEPGPASGNVP
jgi:Ca-activated chloride channel homolog